MVAAGLSLGVCWMLTEPEPDKGDGKFLAYLDKPEEFRRFDPELFDWLKQAVGIEKDRRVAGIETSRLLGAASFYSKALHDAQRARKAYFDECVKHFARCELVFFNPDNGIELSKPTIGCKNSCKYLYWDELCSAYDQGSSAMVYQHIARKQRDIYVADLTDELRRRTHAPAVFSFRTPYVVFLLASQERHAGTFREVIASIKSCWGEQIKPQEHRLTAEAGQPSP
jgi:hypothetical protein